MHALWNWRSGVVGWGARAAYLVALDAVRRRAEAGDGGQGGVGAVGGRLRRRPEDEAQRRGGAQVVAQALLAQRQQPPAHAHARRHPGCCICAPGEPSVCVSHTCHTRRTGRAGRSRLRRLRHAGAWPPSLASKPRPRNRPRPPARHARRVQKGAHGRSCCYLARASCAAGARDVLVISRHENACGGSRARPRSGGWGRRCWRAWRPGPRPSRWRSDLGAPRGESAAPQAPECRCCRCWCWRCGTPSFCVIWCGGLCDWACGCCGLRRLHDDRKPPPCGARAPWPGCRRKLEAVRRAQSWFCVCSVQLGQ